MFIILANTHSSVQTVHVKKSFAAVQRLFKMQEPNEYQGAGTRAKGHRSAEPATKQAAQAKPRKKGSQPPASSAPQPKSPARARGRPRKAAALKGKQAQQTAATGDSDAEQPDEMCKSRV